MTTSISIHASCNRETTEVQVYVWDTVTDKTEEKYLMQDGDKRTINIWGNRVVAIGEIPRESPLVAPVVDLDKEKS